MYSSAIENHTDFVWFLGVVDAVVRNVPNIAFPCSLIGKCMFRFRRLWHSFGVTTGYYFPHKFDIVLLVLLAVSSLESSFKLT